MAYSVINNSGSDKSYLSGAVTITNGGSTAVSDANAVLLASDNVFRVDVSSIIGVALSDGSGTYTGQAAIDALNRLVVPTMSISSNTDTANGKAYVCTTFDLTSGSSSAEFPQVLIKNPTGSGKKMKIYKIAMTTNVSTNNNSFRFYASPTITNNGTALIPVSLHIDGNLTASSMQMFKVPTISANGRLIMNFTVGATSTLLVPFEKEIILEENQVILINTRPNTTGVTYTVDVFWIEE